MSDVDRARLRVSHYRLTHGGAMRRKHRGGWLALLCLLSSAAGWCQDNNPYVYVKMSLAVPWTLYFVFLGAVLIPFLVMIALAWRGRAQDAPDNDSPSR